MKKIYKVIATALVAIFALTGLAACAPVEKVNLDSVAAVLDVRTPAEFGSGHLEGAINLDIQGASFATELELLDKGLDYVVYCRSGNRAGQAITFMKSAGFTGTLSNLGSVADASNATGLPIVIK